MNWDKFVKLPTQVHLSISQFNALALTSSPGNPGWDDGNIKVKIMHPIYYFVLQTVYMFVRIKFIRPLSDFWYFLKSITINRQHILDLRQPKNESHIDEYRYGYVAISEK